MLLFPSLYITGSGIQVQSLQMLLPTDGFGSDWKPFYMTLAWLLLQGWSAIFLGTPEEKAISSTDRPACQVDSRNSSRQELVNPEDVIHWHICTQSSYLIVQIGEAMVRNFSINKILDRSAAGGGVPRQRGREHAQRTRATQRVEGLRPPKYLIDVLLQSLVVCQHIHCASFICTRKPNPYQ